MQVEQQALGAQFVLPINPVNPPQQQVVYPRRTYTIDVWDPQGVSVNRYFSFIRDNLGSKYNQSFIFRNYKNEPVVPGYNKLVFTISDGITTKNLSGKSDFNFLNSDLNSNNFLEASGESFWWAVKHIFEHDCAANARKLN